ncbi:MAG TPA: alpha-amylase/4-alpha-glucanotransferase domain-containing protein, partial [Candidatus Xenobia bacterium]
MTKRIHLALGVHDHQPVGNFGWVLEEAYRLAYQPFLDVLDRFPDIHCNVHVTGPLWQWLKAERPEWLRDLARLAGRGQVEVLGGAFYEPILPNIPDRDKIEQIRRQTREIKLVTGLEPAGMWLAERVWEPSLARPMNQAGIRYTVLDESHFRYAGVPADSIFGYHITEEQGFPLRVFPISYPLRHLMPFAEPEKTLEFLWNHATEGGERIAVMADDGEKFGAWPGTFDLVYRRGWLERFFQLLSDNRAWLTVCTFSQYLSRYPAIDRTYLPTASYFEMMEWAMPASATRTFQGIVSELRGQGHWERYEPFVRGGFWRNFLSKYPESNNVHKKSLLVSDKVAAMRGPQRARAEDELFAGQCNCAYWHGVFGGLYLNHLRSALYRHLITAEALADEERHQGRAYLETRVTDFDCDSRDEILIDTDTINLYLKPSLGGALFELDFKPLAVNLLDILNRREEAYHGKVQHLLKREHAMDRTQMAEQVDAADLDRFLQYDVYRRLTLVDHFLHPDDTFDTFGQRLSDFVDRPYTWKVMEQNQEVVVVLERESKVHDVPVRVQKTLRAVAGAPGFSVEYRVENLSSETQDVWFGIEWNLSFPSGTDAQCWYQLDSQTLEDRQLGSRGTMEH